VEFLNLLCQKMGLPRRAWSITRMTVETYQVEEFSECELAAAIQESTTPLE
jgi:AMMECR1 domain-containing protein